MDLQPVVDIVGVRDPRSGRYLPPQPNNRQLWAIHVHLVP